MLVRASFSARRVPENGTSLQALKLVTAMSHLVCCPVCRSRAGLAGEPRARDNGCKSAGTTASLTSRTWVAIAPSPLRAGRRGCTGRLPKQDGLIPNAGARERAAVSLARPQTHAALAEPAGQAGQAGLAGAVRQAVLL
jgi:hypothetical protein